MSYGGCDRFDLRRNLAFLAPYSSEPTVDAGKSDSAQLLHLRLGEVCRAHSSERPENSIGKTPVDLLKGL